MSRVLGLDVGDRTIGIALSDERGLVALPGQTLQRQPEGYRRDVAAIRDLVDANDVSEVVVGLPLSMNGSVGPQAEKVLAFVEKVRAALTVPVVLSDERFTTSQADRTMRDADVSRKRRSRAVDSMAAALILQGYLDSGVRRGAPEE
jgi:putative Holliday junction resolvase